MTDKETMERVLGALLAGADHPQGFAGMMLDEETAQGRVIVPVGSVTPFAVPADDWVEPIVISMKDGEVYIVAVLAKNPGNGALRRLVGSIKTASLVPVIVAPVGRIMPAILRRWGWKLSTGGEGWTFVEEWRPA